MPYYELTDDLTKDLAAEVFRFYGARSQCVLVALPVANHMTEECNAFIESLIALGGIRKEVFAWPGTRLFADAAAPVFVTPIGHELMDAITKQTDSLFSWIQPDRPEDICFLDSTCVPLFLTTTHEHYALLELSEDDLSIWKGHHLLSRVVPLLRQTELTRSELSSYWDYNHDE